MKVLEVPNNNPTNSHPPTPNGSLSSGVSKIVCEASETEKSGSEHFDRFSSRSRSSYRLLRWRTSKSSRDLDFSTSSSPSDHADARSRPSNSSACRSRTPRSIWMKFLQLLPHMLLSLRANGRLPVRPLTVPSTRFPNFVRRFRCVDDGPFEPRRRPASFC